MGAVLAAVLLAGCGALRHQAPVVHEARNPAVAWEPGVYRCYSVNRSGDARRRLPDIEVRPEAPKRDAAQGGLRLDQPVLAGVPCYRVTVSGPARKGLSVVLASEGLRSEVPLAGLLARSSKPVAVAVAGTYFDTTTFAPVGTIVIDGNVFSRTNVGCEMTVDRAGEVGFHDADVHPDLESYATVIGAGPRVLQDGRLCQQTADFHDPNVLGETLRTMVGRQPNGDVIILVTLRAADLTKAGMVLLAAGARDGMLLDGGACLTMYYDGQDLVTPERSLTNLLVLAMP